MLSADRYLTGQPRLNQRAVCCIYTAALTQVAQAELWSCKPSVPLHARGKLRHGGLRTLLRLIQSHMRHPADLATLPPSPPQSPSGQGRCACKGQSKGEQQELGASWENSLLSRCLQSALPNFFVRQKSISLFPLESETGMDPARSRCFSKAAARILTSSCASHQQPQLSGTF